MSEAQTYEILRASFTAGGLPSDLTKALLDEYVEIKRRYSLHDYRPAAINGGRFCEVVTRILEFKAMGTYTALSEKIEVEKTLNRLDNFGPQLGEMMRLHVVRAIRFVYGIRNTRDNGHVKDGIDPNLQDATAVVGALDWVLAEVVRVWHGVTPVEASEMISGIVTKELPVVEVINGKPHLTGTPSGRDHILILLYWAGGDFVRKSDLRSWLPKEIASRLARHLDYLTRAQYVLVDGDLVYLRRAGVVHAESSRLLETYPSR
jgi:hypothetical protein